MSRDPVVSLENTSHLAPGFRLLTLSIFVRAPFHPLVWLSELLGLPLVIPTNTPALVRVLGFVRCSTSSPFKNSTLSGPSARPTTELEYQTVRSLPRVPNIKRTSPYAFALSTPYRTFAAVIMRVAVASQISIALLATMAWGLPLDAEQRLLASLEGPAADKSVAAARPEPLSPSQAQSPTKSESDDLLSTLKSIFTDIKLQQDDLGRACFCANGAVCCSTAGGLDCTQGLCGL